MKVCTDACLFGAWVAQQIATKKIKANSILDIGGGTGLLSLMLAQKSNAKITTVEINEAAFLQAKNNIEASIFKKNISIFHTSIEFFASNNLFDFIICNPPFFEQQLKSTNADRNMAKHEATLTFEDLAISIEKNIDSNGKVAILIPHNRLSDLIKAFEKNELFIEEIVTVQHSPKHPFFRVMVVFSPIKQKILTSIFAIKTENHQYSTEFVNLLKDYYLNM
jgi:tRNA1Val (adenine37-N6)-methyltransferase